LLIAGVLTLKGLATQEKVFYRFFVHKAREASGFTQEEIARILRTQKSAISRMENHAEDIRLSTLEKFAASVGKKLEVKLA
jgi:HTH-type transcriptional regulator / antitoxin HipB